MKKVSAIIVAGGEGKRFGAVKQSAVLKGKSVLDWTLEKFESHGKVAEIILVLKKEIRQEEFFRRFKKLKSVVPGGTKRQDSVQAGFGALKSEATDVVLVHDGVRPLVTKDLIERVIRAASRKGAAVPVIAEEDTLKYVEGERILRTIGRRRLFRAQTPQGFHYNILKEALEQADRDGYYGTDEASLVERIGKEVVAVAGDARNIKITLPEDIAIAEAFFED